MANGSVGRPRAAELANRCAGTNRAGARCGNAALDGGGLCGQHIGKVDPEKAVAIGERLYALGLKALDTLEFFMNNRAEYPSESVRAAHILTDRVFPKPNAAHAVVVQVMNNTGDVASKSPGEVVRARLKELARATAESRERAEREFGEEMIFDAEIVEESA